MIKNKAHYEKVLKDYFTRCKDSYELCELIQERIDYFSDRWGKDDTRFWVIRQMLSEIERRWKIEHKEKK